MKRYYYFLKDNKNVMHFISSPVPHSVNKILLTKGMSYFEPIIKENVTVIDITVENLA